MIMESLIIFFAIILILAIFAFVSLIYQRGVEDERTRLFWEDGFSEKEKEKYEQQLDKELIKLESGLKKEK